ARDRARVPPLWIRPARARERGTNGGGMSYRVFVYGTLRRGEANHRLLERATFLREARTIPAFSLRDLGAFPGLFAGGHTPVVGEVYEVDAATLARLDRLEGHPSFYRREPIALDDGERVEAYLLPAERAAVRW